MSCVLLATRGASVEKWSALARWSRKLTAGRGSAVSATEATAAIGTHCAGQWLPSSVISPRTNSRKNAHSSRFDGQYGSGAVLADLAGFSLVMRGKDYRVVDHAQVQARLHLPAHQSFSRPESALVRQLYDCPEVPVGPQGQRCRVVVATHLAGKTKSRVGVTRKGIVYELFFTTLPQSTFTAADVVSLYLHRSAFEPTLADEDDEQDPDRRCSHSPVGQEAWQVICQWIWNEAPGTGSSALPHCSADY